VSRPIAIGDAVSVRGSKERGEVRQLVTVKGVERALVRWPDSEQYVDVAKLRPFDHVAAAKRSMVDMRKRIRFEDELGEWLIANLAKIAEHDTVGEVANAIGVDMAIYSSLVGRLLGSAGGKAGEAYDDCKRKIADRAAVLRAAKGAR
jgi:hypothetical protein